MKMHTFKLFIIVFCCSLLHAMEQPTKPGWGEWASRWAISAGHLMGLETAQRELWMAIINAQRDKSALDKIKYLIKQYPQLINAEISARHETPLMLAVNMPHIVKILVAAGADINHKNSQGLTPLMYAASLGLTVALIKDILQMGAKVDLIDNDGRTALHIAIDSYNRNLPTQYRVWERSEEGLRQTYAAQDMSVTRQNILDERLKVIRLLIDSGVNINAQDNNGQTALHIAVQKNALPIVRELLMAQADPYVKDNNQMTVYDLATSPAMKRLLSSFKKKLE